MYRVDLFFSSLLHFYRKWSYFLETYSHSSNNFNFNNIRVITEKCQCCIKFEMFSLKSVNYISLHFKNLLFLIQVLHDLLLLRRFRTCVNWPDTRDPLIESNIGDKLKLYESCFRKTKDVWRLIQDQNICNTYAKKVMLTMLHSKIFFSLQ